MSIRAVAPSLTTGAEGGPSGRSLQHRSEAVYGKSTSAFRIGHMKP